MVQEPTSNQGKSSISELHKLIESSCNKLEKLEQDGLDFIKNDININFKQSCDLNFLLNKPPILNLLIKRKEQYLCAECNFKCNYAQGFYIHYIRQHKSCDNELKIRNSSKLLHRCTKCSFVGFSHKGFASHCSSKHKCFATADIIQTIPLSNSKAEFYLQAYLKTIDGKQKKKIMNLLRLIANKNRKASSLHSANHFGNSNDQEMQCLKCSHKSSAVYYLEEHYQKIHCMNGIERDSTDNLFHCKKCLFSTMSFKNLHLHAVSHSKKLHQNGISDEVNLLLTDSAPASDLTKDNFDQSQNNYETIQETFPECKILWCNLCSFTTESIFTILNHWRSKHSREYPPFVAEHIDKAYNENIVEILLPASQVNNKWVNGWIDDKCMNLIKKPLYCCEYCSFNTKSFKMISTHYMNKHKHVSFSSSQLNVFESFLVSEVDSDKPLLCQQSSLFQCSHCHDYTSCFFKNMHYHYRSNHSELLQSLSEFDFANEIKSSLVVRCMKCKKCYSSSSQLLQHYNETHAADVVTFSLKTYGETEISAECCFCRYICTSLSELFHHLENHRKIYFDAFEQSHVVGYCCSKCRRIFRHKRFLLYHYTRLHVEWNEFSFKYSDFPDQYFVNKVSCSKIDHNKNEEELQAQSNSTDSTVACIQSSTIHSEDKCILSNSASENFFSLTESCHEFSSLTDSPSLNVSSSANLLLKFSCHLCHFTSNFALEMQSHLQVVHEIFATLRKVKYKFSTNRNHITIRTCSHQTYVEKKPMLYKSHIERLHNEEEPYECPHCHQYYVCEVILRMHIRKKHKFDNLECSSARKENILPNNKRMISSCSHAYIQEKKPTLFQNHIFKKHFPHKPFNCPKCNRVYECQSIFLLHLKKKHKLEINEQRVRRYCKVLSEVKTTILDSVDSNCNNQSSVECQSSKDYKAAKSVKTVDGNWKCLYCKQVVQTYTFLKRHILKNHANCRLLRCRWCDYVCRNSVQLTNHMRIHSAFVSERMKVLREICRNKNEITKDGKKEERKKEESADKAVVECPKSRESGSRMDDDIEKVSSASNQVAKKSIRSRVPPRKVFPQAQRDRSPLQYSLTPQGTLRCKHCKFQCTERSRMQWHLKSSHVAGKAYRCKFCPFQNHHYHTLETHLVLHHKMERNHKEAIELCSALITDQTKEVGSDPVDSAYAPQPSLPVISDVTMESEASSVVADLDDTEPTFPQRPSGTPFKCSYCAALLPSSYETECHMIRHERCMMSSSNIDETAMVFAKFNPVM